MPLLMAQSIGIGSLGDAVGWFLLLALGAVGACLHAGLYIAYTFPLVRSRLPLPEWRRFRLMPLVILATCIAGAGLATIALKYKNPTGMVLFPVGFATFAMVAYTMRSTRELQLAAVPIGGLVLVLGLSLAGAPPGALVFFGFIGWHFVTLVLTVIWRETRPSVHN